MNSNAKVCWKVMSLTYKFVCFIISQVITSSMSFLSHHRRILMGMMRLSQNINTKHKNTQRNVWSFIIILYKILNYNKMICNLFMKRKTTDQVSNKNWTIPSFQCSIKWQTLVFYLPQDCGSININYVVKSCFFHLY